MYACSEGMVYMHVYCCYYYVYVADFHCILFSTKNTLSQSSESLYSIIMGKQCEIEQLLTAFPFPVSPKII